MDHALASNLLAYSAQVACIAAAGCALPALLRLHVPAVRFVYWRGLVLLCLALPLIQPKRTIESAADATAATSSVITALGADTAAGGALLSNPAANWPQLLGLLLVAGFVARLLWMGAGLFSLRRLRSAGSPVEDDAATALQRAVGTDAVIRYVPGLTQPVTFGVLRPVVLLPDGLRAHDPEIQRAVLAHELVHVKRRDWAWIVGEELVRAALWFHPAMWWLISRVQLAREEVVDELVVTITGKRRTYVEALLAFADTTPLAPAPAFARRRHLFHRMTLITREAVMSSKRVVLSSAVMALVVGTGGWFAVDAFPMQQQARSGVLTGNEPGPLEKSAKPVTPENPIPRRLSSVSPEYPAEFTASGARATVMLRITVDASGRVAEVRAIKIGVGAKDSAAGATRLIDALTKAAADAVRQWTYEPPADAPISFLVSFRYAPGSPTTSAQLASEPAPRGVAGGVIGGGRGGAAGDVPPGAPQWTADGAVRIGGAVKPPMKIRDVKPVYPEDAKAAGIRGVVIIEARIEPDGSISTARVLRSVEGLNQAALDAVLQWKFTPVIVEGNAVPAIMTVTVNFTLQ